MSPCWYNQVVGKFWKMFYNYRWHEVLELELPTYRFCWDAQPIPRWDKGHERFVFVMVVVNTWSLKDVWWCIKADIYTFGFQSVKLYKVRNWHLTFEDTWSECGNEKLWHCKIKQKYLSMKVIVVFFNDFKQAVIFDGMFAFMSIGNYCGSIPLDEKRWRII